MKTVFAVLCGAAILFGGVACKKYRKYDNMEVVENTYTGNVAITSVGADPAGDFTGDGDSGEYSFVWENPKSTAQVNFDVTTSGGGSVTMVINDAKGNEVLNKTRPGDGDDTFSGVTQEGKSGNWLVTLKLNQFNGDGSFSINPGN
ncbi:MAG: hypothetical protein R3277_03080 [Brumimicrobium sp.]|nr:hypothetical protein [Brumimicrobium sp.]